MKLLPLIVMGQAIIPTLTDLISDPFPVSSMVVDSVAGLITLTAPKHGIPLGTGQTINVLSAGIPNPITSLTLNADGSVTVVTQYGHNLSSAPAGGSYLPFDTTATITGTGITGIDGTPALVSVTDQYTFIITPTQTVSSIPSPISGTSSQIMAGDCIGWTVATATNVNTLTMPTPLGVTRSYTAVNPTIVSNIRVAGAVDLAHAYAHYTRMAEKYAPLKGKCWLFVTPERHVRLSRDRTTQTDAMAEIGPNTAWQQKIIDGFQVFAIIPSETMSTAVGAMDKAAGPLLKAIMNTYNGRRIPHSEFAGPGNFVTVMTGHGWETYDRANYMHKYSFEALIQLGAYDSVPATAIPDLTALDAEIQSNTVAPQTGPIPPIGSWIGSILIDGIVHPLEGPQALTATIPLDSISS